MPAHWRLDSLRCGSTGMTPQARSERWIAVAIGPTGAELTADGLTAESALAALGLAALNDPARH